MDDYFPAGSMLHHVQSQRLVGLTHGFPRITAAKHKRVVGTTDAAAGPYPAQTSYSAYDSELMLWTWAVLVDSSFVFYQLLVRHLGDADRERVERGQPTIPGLVAAAPGPA